MIPKNFSELLGKTLRGAYGMVRNSESIEFATVAGETFILNHTQDCCETVQIEDVCGDVADLIGSPILLAEEVSNVPEPDGHSYAGYSHTWTFYKLATHKGTVTIRWLGESNGYYSECVNFYQVE